MLRIQYKNRALLSNELEMTKGSGTGDVTGLQGNVFAVNSWKDFYTLSVKQSEMGVKKSKENWFKNEHQKWVSSNLGILEGAHLQAENLSQVRDPKLVT